MAESPRPTLTETIPSPAPPPPPTRAQARGDGEGETAYNYNLPADGTPIALPLTPGEGGYTVTVLEHIEDKRYRPVFSEHLDLTLTDPNAPYCYPNRMVNYAGTAAEILAGRLVEETENASEKIDALLTYVSGALTYDEEKSAAAAAGGYIPDLDLVLINGKGICYDYAALLCGMLRSQGIPCKLQVGWAGELYHAWVEVWSDSPGELAGGIALKEGWTTLDPTFLSTQGRTPAMAAYMAGEGNYKVRYTY